MYLCCNSGLIWVVIKKYLYLTRRKLIEIKNLFSKSVLAKTGSSTNNKVADIKKNK